MYVEMHNWQRNKVFYIDGISVIHSKLFQIFVFQIMDLY
jgi:hypothetical protein